MSPPSPNDNTEPDDESDVDADHGEPSPDTAKPDADSDVVDEPTSEQSPQGSTPAPASSNEPAASTGEAGPALAEDDPTVVDSKWWYWVAAVPAYAAVGLLGGIVAFGLFILSIGIDVAGGMGLATGTLVLVGTLVAVLYGLAGLVLFVMFPIGIYLDAQAIAEADVEWEPDPVLYGIVAVTTALFSALLVSLVVAIYYLYRRNQVLGVP